MKPNWSAIIMSGFVVFVGLACAILALTLGKDNDVAKALLFSTAGTAFGSFFRQPQSAGDSARPTQGGHAQPQIIFALLFASLGIGTGMVLVTSSCHNVAPDEFFAATVDCAKVNPNASAALAQVQTCLIGVLAQNYAACLAGLVTEAHFTIDEVTCMVAWFAQQQNEKVGASTATLEDLAARKRALDWLAQEHISIRNSYPGAK